MICIIRKSSGTEIEHIYVRGVRESSSEEVTFVMGLKGYEGDLKARLRE